MRIKIIGIIVCTCLIFGSFIFFQALNVERNTNGSAGVNEMKSASIQWPSFQFDNMNSGRCPYDTTFNQGKEKWRFDTSDWIQYSTTISSDGTIYVGSRFNFYALNNDGTVKWNISLNGMITSAPVIGPSGTVYITDSSGILQALNEDGSIKWSKNISSPHDTSPKIDSDGTIYISSGYGKLYSLDSEGNEKWNFTTNIGTSTPCINSDGTIYIVSDGEDSEYWKLYAINSDGTENWNTTIETYSAISAPTIGPENTIFFGTQEGNLYAVDKDGEVKWTKQIAILYSPLPL